MFGHTDAGILQRLDLGRGRTRFTFDNRPSMPHAPSGRRRAAGDKAGNRFAHVASDIFGRLLFTGAADFTNHDDLLGTGVLFKGGQYIDKAGAVDRIAPYTDTG